MQLQRLNMDNSWFIEIDGLRILVDPWLFGVEIDFFSWFNKQWHRTAPIALDQIPDFDLVLITQKYPDHFHQETLKKLQVKQLICPKSIQKDVEKLLPNCRVQNFNSGINNILDTELNLHFLPTNRKIDPIYDALFIEGKEEGIFLATHGYMDIGEWQDFLSKMPPVKLAICPFDHYQLPFFLGGTVAPGLEGVEKLVSAINPEKIVATHDEDKHAEGLVSKFAKIIKSPNFEKLNSMNFLKGRVLNITNYQIHKI